MPTLTVVANQRRYSQEQSPSGERVKSGKGPAQCLKNCS